MNHDFNAAVAELEIADLVSSERWASYRTMKSVW